MFTQAQLNVLFHVVNNSFGPSFAVAVERANEADGMTREAFIKAYNEALCILTNVSAEDSK